jgi:hypothetical protein
MGASFRTAAIATAAAVDRLPAADGGAVRGASLEHALDAGVIALAGAWAVAIAGLARLDDAVAADRLANIRTVILMYTSLSLGTSGLFATEGGLESCNTNARRRAGLSLWAIAAVFTFPTRGAFSLDARAGLSQRTSFLLTAVGGLDALDAEP